MAKKRKNIVMMIPEGETRSSHTYHYNITKTKNMMGEKMRERKFNPVKRAHEWFVEVKLPPHSK